MSTKTATKKIDPDIITGDEVRFHDEKTIVVPRGEKFSRLIKIFEAKRQEQETISNFKRIYNYRPNDGAVATAAVLKARYGIVMGKAIRHIFGENPPEVLEIPTGPGGQTMQAPWGRIQIPTLDGADVYLDVDEHRDYGVVFEVTVRAKKMYAKEIEEFFADIAEQLRTASIYRGQAVTGADELTFIEDLDKFDPTQIVLPADKQASLDAALFAPLRWPDAFRSEGIAIKRAVLLYGKYGTGKTSIGMILAQIATAHGWTFIMSRPGRDRVQDVLTTARLYAPSVVWYEDIDTQGTNNPKEISAMLDAFDGINSKSGDIVVALSTNHIDKLPAGLLRPGRFDYVEEIGALDRDATERLIRLAVRDKLTDDINFDLIYEQMTGFLPAFARAAADRARTFAIARMGGRTNYRLTTDDLVFAARSLHAQLKLHQDAAEPAQTPTLDRVVRELVTGGVDGMNVRGPGLPTLTISAPVPAGRRG